ncbi:MAG: cytochrome c oxidase cbb3-type subunit [Sphingomonadales bacterium]|nr:cytochrome c oxidase cbb3-type subunit [Sphingomonadales bacterium]
MGGSVNGGRRLFRTRTHPRPLPACREGGLLLLALFALAACDREQRDLNGQPKSETQSYLASGDPRAKEYENNAFAIAQGQRLYMQMNCVGCHFHGGGGMGPPLMDDQWRYGARMEDIVATILDGRPNGMPRWRDKITEQQAWQLAAYVRSLSMQPREDALPSRSDEMSTTEPQTLDERRAIRPDTKTPPPSEERN